MNQANPKPIQPAPADAKRVLVIKFGALSDFIQSLAAAKLIREHHFGARITLLTNDEFIQFAEKCPYFDIVEGAGPARDPKPSPFVAARIRRGKFDMTYDLECSPRTGAFYLTLKPWRRRWSGVAQGCSHPHANAERDGLHPLDRFAEQLHHAGLGPAEGFAAEAAPLPDLSWVRMALRDPPRLHPGYFGIKPPYVLFIPGADPEAPERLWPPERYAELARLLAGRGIASAVVGTAPERETGNDIVRGEPKVKNLISRTDLFQLAALSERAAAVVGVESGAMTMAAAAGAPCVVLYGGDRDPTPMAPRSAGGVLKLLAPQLSDLKAEEVVRAIGNLGALQASVHA
ncbi:MAG: glycosyltransferase family 9 protein [Hyphomonadaceae bacterium]